MKSFLFCALEYDNTVSKERLKVSNYLLIILLYTCLCTNIYKMFSQHYVSHFRNPFCSPVLSLLKSKTHCTLLSLQWNALPYIGKFDGRAAFGIYGLAATCGHNNTNQALQPCCFTHAIQCSYGYGQSMVTANLWWQSIYGYGQSTVTANLWLRPLYFVTTASLPITVLLYLDYMHFQSATLVQ